MPTWEDIENALKNMGISVSPWTFIIGVAIFILVMVILTIEKSPWLQRCIKVIIGFFKKIPVYITKKILKLVNHYPSGFIAIMVGLNRLGSMLVYECEITGNPPYMSNPSYYIRIKKFNSAEENNLHTLANWGMFPKEETELGKEEDFLNAINYGVKNKYLVKRINYLMPVSATGIRYVEDLRIGEYIITNKGFKKFKKYL